MTGPIVVSIAAIVARAVPGGRSSDDGMLEIGDFFVGRIKTFPPFFAPSTIPLAILKHNNNASTIVCRDAVDLDDIHHAGSLIIIPKRISSDSL